MSNLVNQYKNHPLIRQKGTALVQSVANKDWVGEINAIFNFVRNYIRYTRDIENTETIQTPVATLKLQHGDCDDMSMLLAALLATVGINTRFVAVGFAPQCFDHVYVEALEPDTGEWIACDPTEPNNLGWSAPGVVCRMQLEN